MRKVYGSYRSVVVNVEDPKKLDRIRVRVPEVLGNVITDWVWPKHPAPHWSWKPKKDERVWVEFEAGDVDRPMYTGTWYPQQDGNSTVPSESQDEYPFHRMIATPAGHKIEFKDISEDEEGAPVEDSTNYTRLSSANGHMVELDDTKDAEHLLIQTRNGTKIELIDTPGTGSSPGDEKAIIETPAGHKFTMDDENTELSIEHSDGVTLIKMDSSGNIEINAQTSPPAKIKLSGAALVYPLAGVVTKNHNCAYTGGPHPFGSADVEASG